MKKIKFLLMSAMLALTLVAVLGLGLKASAASYGSDKGLEYEVSKTVYDNDTATYDILPTAQITLAAGDKICDRIIVEAVGSGMKLNTGYGSFKANSIWTIPVPASSAGKVEYSASSTSAGRSYNLIDSAGNIFEGKTVDCAKPTVMTFDSTHILTDDTNGSYLKFKCTGGELKPTGIKVVLTTGAFEATATKYKVSYYLKGATTSFATDDVASDQTALLPTLWGYDLLGFYTDPECSTPWDKTVSGECSIYCEYKEWADEVYGDGNELSVDLITRCQSTLPLGTDPIKVPRTIYTILGNVTYAADVQTINGTNSTHSLNTGGAFKPDTNTRGILIDVPSAGQISIYVTGANKDRNVSLYDGSTALDTQVVNSLQEITFNVSKSGQYRIGADGSIHIFEVKYTPAPAVNAKLAAQFADDATKTDLRLLGTLEGIEDLSLLTDVKFVLTLKDADGVVKSENKEVAVPTLYRAITGLEGFAAAENTYYAVFVITEVQAVVTELQGASIEASLSFTYNGEVKTVSMNNAINLIVAAVA